MNLYVNSINFWRQKDTRHIVNIVSNFTCMIYLQNNLTSLCFLSSAPFLSEICLCYPLLALWMNIREPTPFYRFEICYSVGGGGRMFPLQNILHDLWQPLIRLVLKVFVIRVVRNGCIQTRLRHNTHTHIHISYLNTRTELKYVELFWPQFPLSTEGK